MAQETFTRESFFAELDKLGEEVVRTRVVTRAYTSVNAKLPLAQEWLRLRDQARSEEASRRIESANLEQIRIARSAKNAAWAAAIAAIIAAIFAIIAWLSTKG